MNLGRRFEIGAAIFIFLIILLTLYLTKDFLTTILLSVVLVFLLKPLYDLFFRLTGRRQISSFLSIMLVFIIILSLILSITSALLVELSNLQASGAISNVEIDATINEIDAWSKSVIPSWLYDSIIEISLRYVQEISDIPIAVVTWAFPILQRELASLGSNLPILFAHLIVVVFFTYYLLIDGKDFIAQAVELVPQEKQDMIRRFLQELYGIYHTLFTVYFSTSMLSGVMAAIGFSLLGIPYPFLLGVVVAVFTLLPLLGPPFVFIPIALYYLIVGDILRCLILVVFGTVVLMIIPENVIRPHLAMMSSRIHPILTLLAYTAPIFVIGIIGVIVGPTLYGFLLAVYRVVKMPTEKHFDQPDSKTS